MGSNQFAFKWQFNLKFSKLLSWKRCWALTQVRYLYYMSYWASRSSIRASSQNEERMSKTNSEIPVIDIENIDYTRGFIDCTNIQDEEYNEQADVILERIQDKSRRQENPKEKRRKLCDHLKSLFHQKLWFFTSHPKRPVTQVIC